MLLEVTRSYVRLQVGEKTVKIPGEMLVPSPGVSDYLIYASSPTSWEPPFQDEILDKATKDAIIQTVEHELSKLGRIPEVV